MPVVSALRLAWLDAYQGIYPRKRTSAPAVIVAIDESSLTRFGQWPWPRTLVAELIDKVSAARPAAIGIDILFPEADRHSPEWVARSILKFDPALAERLMRLPRGDTVLAASIASAPVALGIAGTDLRAASTVPERLTPSLQKSADAGEHLRQYASALRSLPVIDRAAKGHGLLNAETEGGIVRKVPIAARIGSSPVLPLSLETLRVAGGEPLFVVRGSSTGVAGVEIGDLFVPTDSDGYTWLYYTPHDESRFVSAAGVLDGRVDRSLLERKLVLLGVTGLGLVDYRTTPLGEGMPGVEIHAQVLENVFDGTMLRRPGWAPWGEGGAFLAASLLLIYVIPRRPPAHSVTLLLVLIAGLGASGFLAYNQGRLLLDAAIPGATIFAVFAAMLAETLSDANAQRKRLRERLRTEREAAVRLSGELDAARRIQVGILPRPEAMFSTERRFEIAAFMEPAREVGGDLYDFFFLDADRLFFIVGDVSGKGLPASIFMAVSKALCKSSALRSNGRLDELMRSAAADISRENPESLFVTAFAGVLNAETGLLEYCNAGHEPPYVFGQGGAGVRLDGGGGPPLCVLDDFPYGSAEYRMRRGETLCLVSDGVTEAMNSSGSLYGSGRLRKAIERAQRAGRDPQKLLETLQGDIAQFVGGAEATDDLTLLVLRWTGPNGC